MIYFVTKDWPNTSSNHAGMQYLCRSLSERYPDRFRCVTTPENVYSPPIPRGNSLAIRVWRKAVTPILLRIHGKKLQHAVMPALKDLQPDDTVLLMEYLDPFVMQLSAARTIRKHYPQVRIAGMSHLVPAKLQHYFSRKEMLRWLHNVDAVCTLGSSLSTFLQQQGAEKERILTLFHYVDEYYRRGERMERTDKDPLRVIAMGNQMRDINTLQNVVRLTPEVEFVICQGMMDMSRLLPYPNVQLVPFVEESELRSLMYSCDVSLNCMTDTIGSNVIVCSLAAGLAMVCSDVGSIRDYCDTSNTIFVPGGKNGAKAASTALKDLAANRKRLAAMHKASALRALDFSMDGFAALLEKKSAAIKPRIQS